MNEPHRLEEDQGSYPLDQNSLRWPKHPIEPTIRAAFDLNPNLKPEEIDVVTCAGILGNLFKFASSFPWSFRFDLEKVGNTVFMVRNEGKGVIKGIHGCGHTFRAKNTSWDPSVKESVSHQRVLRYKFGGLNFLLRFEADGFLPDLVQQEKDPFVIVGHHTAATKSDPMAETLELKIISGQLELPDEQKKLRIIRPISFIPHGALFELKTRNMSNEIDMSIQFPRLWARQIKNFILAYHQDGKFGKDITIQNVVAGVKNWEVENQSTLSLVAAILNKLIAEVNNSAHGKLEVSRHKSGPLILRVQRGLNRDVLPENLKAKWANNNSADKQEDNDSSYDNEEWDLINHNEW